MAGPNIVGDAACVRMRRLYAVLLLRGMEDEAEDLRQVYFVAKKLNRRLQEIKFGPEVLTKLTHQEDHWQHQLDRVRRYVEAERLKAP